MLNYQILADSCLDADEQMRIDYNIKSVPLTITLGDTEYVDKNLDIDNLLQKIKECKTAAKTACPSPFDFESLFIKAATSFGITLSAKLSGTYNSAILGKELVQKTHPDKNIHIFDSKSASAGEILIAMKIKEYVTNNFDFSEVVEKVENFISNMSTFFILEDLSTLIKNGRMNMILGYAAMALQLRPIMAGKNGSIELHEKVRGSNQAIAKLSQIIADKARRDNKKKLVITHCNNKSGAEKLKELVSSLYNFSSISIHKTQGLSTVYANKGGIIVAF